MGKLIVPVLALGLVGVGAWFLLSKDDPKPSVPAAAMGKESVRSAEPAAAASDGAKAPKAPIKAARPVVKNALPRTRKRPTPTYKQATKAGAPITAAPVGQPAPARPIVKTDMLAVQDTVRRYYGNLPKSGTLPAVVTMEEVLPAEAIAQLGAPADARVSMLGPWPVSNREAFKEVLVMDRRYDSMLGVSWTMPDGTEARDYISLKAPDSPLK
jgi:hypothetical protein